MLRLLSLLLVTVSTLASGCAMCSTPYDCHYSAYGGRSPRGDRVYGRVGSAFRDASAMAGFPVDGNLVEGEFFDGQYTEGQYAEGTIIDGGVVESHTPNESEFSGLPSTGNESYAAPLEGAAADSYYPTSPPDEGSYLLEQIDLPNTMDGAVDNLINHPGGTKMAPGVPDISPFGSHSPTPAERGTSLPNLDRIFEGLPPVTDEAVIQMHPAVLTP